MYGQDFNPHTYGLMESCADHIHWAAAAARSRKAGKASRPAATPTPAR